MRSPFPYFGAKAHAAPLVWQAIGADVGSYVEPFAGSLAVLLARPGGAGRIETVNDLSGHVANFWRAVRECPEELAAHADYPVIEADLHTRHRWLWERGQTLAVEIDRHPRFCDPRAAAWWAWGASAWVGSGWCDGRLARQLPKLSDAGAKLHSPGADIPEWIAALAARLRRVRVACGDWRRLTSRAVLCVATPTHSGTSAGLFLDPPYDDAEDHEGDGKRRATRLYESDDPTVARDVARRAEELHADAERLGSDLRIVVAGYAGGAKPAGFREVAWDPSTLQAGGGYGRKNGNGRRERLWLSPMCQPVQGEVGAARQRSIFDLGGALAG